MEPVRLLNQKQSRLFYAMMGSIIFMLCSGKDWCRLFIFDAITITEEVTVSLGILNLRCAGVVGNTLYVFGKSESDILILKVLHVQTRIVTETIFPGSNYKLSRSRHSIGLEIFFTRSLYIFIYNTVYGFVRSIVLPQPRAPRQWFNAATCAFHGVLLFHNYRHGLTWYDESALEWKVVTGFNLAGIRRLTSLGLGIADNRLLVVWSVRKIRGVADVLFCRQSLEKTQTGDLMGVFVHEPLLVAKIRGGYKVIICLSLARTQDDDNTDTGEASKMDRFDHKAV